MPACLGGSWVDLGLLTQQGVAAFRSPTRRLDTARARRAGRRRLRIHVEAMNWNEPPQPPGTRCQLRAERKATRAFRSAGQRPCNVVPLSVTLTDRNAPRMELPRKNSLYDREQLFERSALI